MVPSLFVSTLTSLKSCTASLALKLFIEDYFQIGSGREFHSAAPATSNIRFLNCRVAAKSSFDAEVLRPEQESLELFNLNKSR